MSLPTSPPKRRGSALRVVISVVLVVASFAVAVFGGLRLADVLDHGGYGTPAVTNALLILVLAGGMLATGVALFIWDMSLRHEEPRRG